MCGRFSLSTDTKKIAEHFQLELPLDLQPRYNIAPTQSIAAVRTSRDGGSRELAMLHWGLVPFWAEDPATGSRMINARSETIASKPAYRHAIRKRRCIIPADHFYEWKKTPDGKQPMAIHLLDKALIGFAGIWERWEGVAPSSPNSDRGTEDGAQPGLFEQEEPAAEASTVLESCSILTTTPNEWMARIHSRMPVILHPEDYERWLDRSIEEPSALTDLFEPFPADRMTGYPVSRRVNSPRNDDADLLMAAPARD